MESFKDPNGNEIVLELTESPVDPSKQIPRKLGDGNFGCVFAAQNGVGERFALKVIYAHQADSIEKRARVRDELNVAQKISEALLHLEGTHPEYAGLRNAFPDHLVMPLQSTEQFKSDSEFGAFRDTFAALDMEFSDFAYLMRRYDKSLKDLMDYGDSSSRDPDSGVSGYARLRDIPLIERERSALPVLQQVAGGLRVLHAVHLRHQDIKPANIYYLGDQGNIYFRLGDLGFLNPTSPVVAGSAMVSQDSLAIGTKHYRSVEQIDYADTSEVSVTVDESTRTAELLSRDPKFLRSNIGEGDLVVFPKSKSRRLYPIQEVDRDEEATLVRMQITLNPTVEDQEAGVEHAPVYSEDLTQASFIKKPTAKTDLFGLGAILFDIISAGESPERFYELLRKFDAPGVRISQAILAFYPTWISGQYVDPEVSAIFHRVCRGQPAFAVHEEVLKFLLRTMMSEPEDSYYKTLVFQDDLRAGQQSPWKIIQDDIRELRRAVGADVEYDTVDGNALTSSGPIESGEPSDASTPVTVNAVALIENLKTMEASAEGGTKALGTRWLRGGAFLANVYNELYRADAVGGGTQVLKSFAPENLQINLQRSTVAPHENIGGVQDADDLVKKLCSIDPFLTSISAFESCFLPTWWPKRSRRIGVSLAGDAPGPVGAPGQARRPIALHEHATDRGIERDRSVRVHEHAEGHGFTRSDCDADGHHGRQHRIDARAVRRIRLAQRCDDRQERVAGVDRDLDVTGCSNVDGCDAERGRCGPVGRRRDDTVISGGCCDRDNVRHRH